MKLAKVRELLNEKLTEAVMLERERCAKIADDMNGEVKGDPCDHTAGLIAAKIRSGE